MFNESSREFMPNDGSLLLAPTSADNTLLRQFNSQFKTLQADTAERLRIAHTIRYQVYCVENRLESSGDNPLGLETDEFDAHSVHSLVIHRGTGLALATVRLILPLVHEFERSFALQHLMYPDSLKILRELPRQSTAEVSRFSISRHARHRLKNSPRALDGTDPTLERISGPLTRLGLVQGLVRMSIQNGITHWCALVEPTLLRMLSAMAIRFRPIGPEIEFRGMRQACWLNVSEMLNAVMCERPRFWELITDAGALRLSSAA